MLPVSLLNVLLILLQRLRSYLTLSLLISAVVPLMLAVLIIGQIIMPKICVIFFPLKTLMHVDRLVLLITLGGKNMGNKIEVRQPFVYDFEKVSAEVVVKCLDPSKAVQDAKDDCDINTIVKRFGLTGEVPVLQRVPLTSDFVGITSYMDAQLALIEAGKTFMSLPADLRERFHHDPGEFVDFCSDEKNRDEMLKLGLLKPPEPEFAPFKVEVVNKAEPPA